MLTAHLADGYNVAVEAVPGAGKTHLLLQLCDDGIPTLILAYNRELAQRVMGALNSELCPKTTCLTFHALCSRCLSLARDDHQLMSVVLEAERGGIVPAEVPNVRRVLIDEAQDVRELYVRLLGVLGLTRSGIQIVVAGDCNQLVYDFDDDFPASLTTLKRPGVAFGNGEWRHVVLNRSHRVTDPICSFVNLLFATSITSDKEGPRVEIRVPSNMYSDLLNTIDDLLDGDVLLLVDHKQGNRALRTLLNKAGRLGRTVRVHGVLSPEKDGETSIITCGTFWSAKGLEADTVIVLLPGGASFNPTYVAMTRARQRLVVVLDPRDPHPMVSRIVLQNHPFVMAASSPFARQVFERGASTEDPEVVSFEKRKWKNNARFRCLDRFVPKQSIVDGVIGHAAYDVFSSSELDSGNTTGEVSVLMGLIRAEYEETGAIRAMQDLLYPTRLDYVQHEEVIRKGLMGRIVPRFVKDDELLAPDLRGIALAAYKNVSSITNVANVALAIMSWDSWECTMRSMQPAKDWAHTAKDAVQFVGKMIPSGAQYDVRLMNPEKTLHVRVQATTPDTAYHFVWEVTSMDLGYALVRAALHPKGNCVLVQVSNEESFQIHADPDDVASIVRDV